MKSLDFMISQGAETAPPHTCNSSEVFLNYLESLHFFRGCAGPGQADGNSSDFARSEARKSACHAGLRGRAKVSSQGSQRRANAAWKAHGVSARDLGNSRSKDQYLCRRHEARVTVSSEAGRVHARAMVRSWQGAPEPPRAPQRPLDLEIRAHGRADLEISSATCDKSSKAPGISAASGLTGSERAAIDPLPSPPSPHLDPPSSPGIARNSNVRDGERGDFSSWPSAPTSPTT